jgi:hypothetical protein
LPSFEADDDEVDALDVVVAAAADDSFLLPLKAGNAK